MIRRLMRAVHGELPDFTVRDYLSRWHLVPRNRCANAYVHRLVESDVPVPHDHPWANVSIVLRGTYREHFHDGTYLDRRPGAIVLRSARQLHWLQIIDGPVVTLFLTGPRRRVWGFMTTHGWVEHYAFDRQQTADQLPKEATCT